MNQAVTLRIARSREEVVGGSPARSVDFTILQLNDVYDATPVEGGRRGGLARVATLLRRLRAENPNTYSVMVGDFLAPSAIGAITGDGGMHMILALNAMGLTYATMGNHEFDVGEDWLRERIVDSEFKWVVSNVKDERGDGFAGVDERALITATNGRGDAVRVALIGLCTDLTKKSWLRFEDPIACAARQVAEIGAGADVFVAMTHLPMSVDQALGGAVRRLDVLLGGHEHEAATAIVGDDATPIFKADSNARSAFVHRFRFDVESRVTTLHSEIVHIDAGFAEEPATAAVIRGWQDMAFATLRAQGHEPLAVVGSTDEPLNGAEADLRKQPTNLGQLVAETFLAEVPEADAAFLIAGLLRIDGVIPPGEITYYDVVRIFPVGGKLSVLRLPGPLLRTMLGMAKPGEGSYPVLAGIARVDGGWTIRGAPVRDDAVYTIVYAEFPAAYFAYPPFKGSGGSKLYDTRGMREILVDRLRRDLARAATGTPCRAELSAPDVAGAQGFYGAVFGWEFAGDPAGGTVVAAADGRAVAVIVRCAADGPTRGGWTVYFACGDIEAAAERVRALGGRVLVGPRDASPTSRRLLATDRGGGVFGLWQDAGARAFEPSTRPGAVCWREVTAPDVGGARAFYGALLGLEVRTFLGVGESYELLGRGDTPICQLTPGEVAGWTHHFAVADVDDAVRRVESAGGTIVDRRDTPYARLAIVADPWGSSFAVVQGPVIGASV